MEFLGIGFAELVLIMLLALVVVGPERLPKIARTIGRMMRQVRQVSSEFTAEFKKEAEALDTASRETARSVKEALPKPDELTLDGPESRNGTLPSGEQRSRGPASDA